MKKKKFFPLSMGIGFLFTGLFCCFSVSADAVEGSPGQTVSGEYAVARVEAGCRKAQAGIVPCDEYQDEQNNWCTE